MNRLKELTSSYSNLDRQSFQQMDFRTGDIILFSADKGLITKAIQCWTKSKYSHVAMVIRNPNFPNFQAEGVFMIESTTLDPLPDAEDHEHKIGVQLHDLHKVIQTYPGKAYWRRLHYHRDLLFQKRLQQAHAVVHDKPYDLDPEDWIEIAFKEYSRDLQTKKRYICSALVAYFYVALGIIDPKTPWSIIEPCDWGTEPKAHPYRFTYLNGGYLDDEIEILIPKKE